MSTEHGQYYNLCSTKRYNKTASPHLVQDERGSNEERQYIGIV